MEHQDALFAADVDGAFNAPSSRVVPGLAPLFSHTQPLRGWWGLQGHEL